MTKEEVEKAHFLNKPIAMDLSTKPYVPTPEGEKIRRHIPHAESLSQVERCEVPCWILSGRADQEILIYNIEINHFKKDESTPTQWTLVCRPGCVLTVRLFDILYLANDTDKECRHLENIL